MVDEIFFSFALFRVREAVVVTVAETVDPTEIIAASVSELTVTVFTPETELAHVTRTPAFVYVGCNVGSTVGAAVGESLGSGVGLPGLYVGSTVGSLVGSSVGSLLGFGVGEPLT